MTTEEIIKRFGSQVVSKGYRKPNLEGSMQIQTLIEDYILMLQNKVDEGLITPGSCIICLPPVKLFCEMNDIILNWRKIARLLPRRENNASDEAYDRQRIKKMLEHCDLRSKIPILFMASGGMRLGGFACLKDGDVEPIYDDNDPAKVLAAHVILYRGTSDEYDTFITPEAWKAYDEYRKIRTKFGENITKDSPLMVRRFNVNKDGSPTLVNNVDQKNNLGIGCRAIIGILTVVAYKADVREPSKNYNERYNIKLAHGFRKFFNTTLRSVKTRDGQPAIQYIHKEWMMGHALKDMHAMEENYDRSDRVKILLGDYLKAVPELTISEEERLKVEVKRLKTDISNMKSVSIELDEKDQQIQELIRKQEEMEKKFQMIFSKIDGRKLG